eukprot:scaffold666_cov332-Prasinococcus_capsulatus_cf.AAC.22
MFRHSQGAQPPPLARGTTRHRPPSTAADPSSNHALACSATRPSNSSLGSTRTLCCRRKTVSLVPVRPWAALSVLLATAAASRCRQAWPFQAARGLAYTHEHRLHIAKPTETVTHRASWAPGSGDSRVRTLLVGTLAGSEQGTLVETLRAMFLAVVVASMTIGSVAADGTWASLPIFLRSTRADSTAGSIRQGSRTMVSSGRFKAVPPARVMAATAWQLWIQKDNLAPDRPAPRTSCEKPPSHGAEPSIDGAQPTTTARNPRCTPAVTRMAP